MPQVRLTYLDGRFRLKGDVCDPGENWDGADDGVWSTVDAREAVLFSRYASKAAEDALARKLVKRYSAPTESLPSFLDPHQINGVRWILTRSRSYLAHAPGAGKTLQAIVAAMRAPSSGQVLFIVPPSLTVNWERELTRWAAEVNPSISLRYSIVTETADAEWVDWNADFLLIPDSMLHKAWVISELLSRKYLFVAVDEASRFKEPGALRTVALFGGCVKDFKSTGIIYRSKYTTLMDGSPMGKRPIELWAPTFAMAPETIDFKDRVAFGHRYCAPTVNSYGRIEFRGSANERELNQKLTKEFMHIVPESALSHPERRRSMLFMDDVRSKRQCAWEEANLSRINFSDLGDEIGQGDLARFRAELGMRKVPWIARYVKERLTESSEAVILFAWHRPVVLALAKALHHFKPGVVLGGVKIDDRERAFRNFQGGRTNLIIGNIAAMGRGNNLQRADRIIFGEFSWSDETNKQAEKRASRRGRNAARAVRCEYVVCPNSMDEPVLKSVFRGARNVRKVIGE